jgi:hypothetical protein
MFTRAYLATLTILLVTAEFLTRATLAQTIELRNVQLDVLVGDEQARFLAAHNAARAAVHVSPVVWSRELSKYALESLEQQKLSIIDAAVKGWPQRQVALPMHRATSKYGENVAGWYGTRGRTADWAVSSWLREKAVFDKLNAEGQYRVGDEDDKWESDDQGLKRPIVVGHYTATIWKATREIGAAILTFELSADSGEVRKYAAVICNYNPPGNRYGERPY